MVTTVDKQQELLQLQCDIALITESWFNSNHDDAILMIPGYTLFRRDRSFGKGEVFVHTYAVILIVQYLCQIPMPQDLINQRYCG